MGIDFFAARYRNWKLYLLFPSRGEIDKFNASFEWAEKVGREEVDYQISWRATPRQSPGGVWRGRFWRRHLCSLFRPSPSPPTSFEGGWMSRTMGEIGEVIQAERIGLRHTEREAGIRGKEGRGSPSVFSAHFVNPNIHWITLPPPSQLRFCPEIRTTALLL